MDIQRAVAKFVSDGKDVYQRLRSKGEELSDVDLVALREQLYILDTEAGRLQDLKEYKLEDANFIFNGKRPYAAKPLSRKAA